MVGFSRLQCLPQVLCNIEGVSSCLSSISNKDIPMADAEYTQIWGIARSTQVAVLLWRLNQTVLRRKSFSTFTFAFYNVAFYRNVSYKPVQFSGAPTAEAKFNFRKKKLSMKQTSLLFHEESLCPRLYTLDVCQKWIKNIRTLFFKAPLCKKEDFFLIHNLSNTDAL